MTSARRRLLRTGAFLVALALAYAAGIVTGVVGSDVPSRRASASTSGGVLDEAIQKINDDAAEPVNKQQLQRAAVDGMLAALGDRWSQYLAPADYARFTAVLDGRYSGVGLWVRRDGDGIVRISSVQPGSPAAKAGLFAGDAVLEVDGRDVSSMSVASVVSALRGSSGTTVSVTIRRSGVDHTVAMQRQHLEANDVTVEQLTPTVSSIRVAAFTAGVGREVRNDVAKLRADHVGGIVLDLRDNPGGLLDEAVEVASVFLSGGPVVTYVRRGQPAHTLAVVGADADTATPLAVLVDGGTASAAEVVAGALQDRNRAVLVGSQTFGKGSVQQSNVLSDGSALELTVGHYVTPSGRSLDGVGLEPDVEVSPGSGPDVAQQRAVEVLSGLLADSGATGRG